MLSQIKLAIQVLRRALTASQTPKSVPFDLKCDCGADVQGERRTSWIEAECPSCFQSLFVMPGNVYPATKSVPSGVLTGSLLERIAAAYQELKLPAEETKVKKTGKDATPVPEEVAEKVEDELPVQRKSFDVGQLLRRTFTPFRLIVCAMLLLVGGTAYWVIQQRSMEAARAVWLKAADDIDGMVVDRRFTELEEMLTEAVSAGRTLERDDAQWRRTRNLLHETRAIINLANDDFPGVFLNAYDSAGNLKAGGEDDIRDAAESGSFILETIVRPTPDSGFFSLDLPMRVGRHDLKITAGMPALAEFIDTYSDGRVFVSVEIADVTAPESEEGSWLIEVAPMSFTLIITPEYCDEVGLSLTDDQSLAELVERQREFVSESRGWDQRTGVSRKTDEVQQ